MSGFFFFLFLHGWQSVIVLWVLCVAFFKTLHQHILQVNWRQTTSCSHVKMEGLYFEVKLKQDESKNRPVKLTSNRHSSPSFSNLSTSIKCQETPRSVISERAKSWGSKLVDLGEKKEEDEGLTYKLKLIGSLPVHHLTTMTMLPWVVAEISRSRPVGKETGTKVRSVRTGVGHVHSFAPNQMVSLCVSTSWVQCGSALEEGAVWDPLSHTVLFECRPHQVTKLIHNSQDPGSFGCLVKKEPHCACFVFQCQDSTKVGGCGRGQYSIYQS